MPNVQIEGQAASGLSRSNAGLGRTPLRTVGEKKMNIPTHEQMSEILGQKLASEYPDECVEIGENWELIAEIFFKAGFDAASAD